MKSLLEFKKELIKINKPRKELENCFSNLCNLLKSWEIDVDSIKFTINNCSSSPDKDNFDERFIEDFIKVSLAIPNGNPLWNKSFYIKKTISTHIVTVIKYEFILKDKISIIKEIQGDWIYSNYGEVEEFMKKENIKYNRLLDIKKNLFPLEFLE